MKITRSLAEPFDVDAWNDEQEGIDGARERRKARRRAKRRRLNLPVSDTKDSADEMSIEAVSPVSSEDDVPLARIRRARQHGNLADSVVEEDDGDGDAVKQSNKRRATQAVSDDEDTHSGADSLMEELGHEEARKITKKGIAQVIKNVQGKPRQPVKQETATKPSVSRQDCERRLAQPSRETVHHVSSPAKSTASKTPGRSSLGDTGRAPIATSATVKKSAIAATTMSTTIKTAATGKLPFTQYSTRSERALDEPKRICFDHILRPFCGEQCMVTRLSTPPTRIPVALNWLFFQCDLRGGGVHPVRISRDLVVFQIRAHNSKPLTCVELTLSSQEIWC